MATPDQTQNSGTYQPPAGLSLDMSTSVPVPAQPAADSTPAYTPPKGVKLDMKTSVPVPPPPPPGNTGGAGGSYAPAGVAGGFMKPQAEAATGIANLIARGAEIMTGQPKGSLQATASNPQPLSTSGELGEVAGNVAQWMGVEEGVKFLQGLTETAAGLANASKYIHTPAAWAEYLKESPKAAWLLKAVGNVGRGTVAGATVGGTQGAATGQAKEGAETGAVQGAAGGAIQSVIEPVSAAIRNLRVNPFRMADEAVRTGTEAATANAGVADQSISANIKANPIVKGATNILQEPLAAIEDAKNAAYKKLDDAAQFDLKDTKASLKNDKYRLAQPGLSPAEHAQIQTDIIGKDTAIKQAEARLSAQGIDPKEADVLNAKWQAGQYFQNLLTRATDPDGKIDVNKLSTAVKNARFQPRWGDRIGMFMGKQGADDFQAQLAAAAKAGMAKAKAQDVLKWIGKGALTLAAGHEVYEGGKAIAGALHP